MFAIASTSSSLEDTACTPILDFGCSIRSPESDNHAPSLELTDEMLRNMGSTSRTGASLTSDTSLRDERMARDLRRNWRYSLIPAVHALVYRRVLREAEPMVYGMREGNEASRTPEMRGGKGAALARLARLSMPVPPAVTITTDLHRYLRVRDEHPAYLTCQLAESLRKLEKETELKFGSRRRPLLVSVRSGAPVSMPGMMDTVLNVGLNDRTVHGLARRADERFAWDSYRRFLAMFGSTVMGVDKSLFEERLIVARRIDEVAEDSQLSVTRLQDLCRIYKQIIRHVTGKGVPADPMEQLSMAILAVRESWFSARCVAYRQSEKIEAHVGTAINIQAMVFGNAGATSGTGVVFSRNPLTGEKGMYGEYLANAQGEDVVAGVRTPQPVASLATLMPEVYAQLDHYVSALEFDYQDIVDVEFTVEAGRLFILQCRSAKRSAEASAHFAVDQVLDGHWNRSRAIATVGYRERERLAGRVFKADALATAAANYQRLALKGLGASPGAAVGQLVFSCEQAQEKAARGESVILVSYDTSPNDLPGMLVSRAIVTACGGTTSHAAVVARGKGIPAVVGTNFQMQDFSHIRTLNGEILGPGDVVSVDGSTGVVVRGALPLVEASADGHIRQLLEWVEKAAMDTAPQPICSADLLVEVSLNTYMNDFYLADLMRVTARDGDLYAECTAYANKLQARLAAIFTCYLAYAVATEVTFYSDSQCNMSPPIAAWAELKRRFGVTTGMTASHCTRVIGRLAEMTVEETGDFFELARQCFSEHGWSACYGGPKWAVIARTGRDYCRGALPRSVFIDHVFDLRHNGGCMFNKHLMVSSTNEARLVEQLNAKKRSVSLGQLYEKLRDLAHFSDEADALFLRGCSIKDWERVGMTNVVPPVQNQRVSRLEYNYAY